jgi:phosphoglycolate phosphatase (TIGR01487 family)
MRKLALGRGITGTPAEPFSWRLMWYFRAIAVDLDGTLASNDAVHPSALQAIETTRRERRMVLVTGRTMEDLRTGFPGLTARFDAVVTENGGVLHTRTSTRQLAEPVDPAVDKALADRGVVARRGRVLVAVDGGDVGTVVQVLTALGLDCQVVHNRAAAMILPAGVTKGSGLTYALDELGLSAHNTIAVGDAENDFALLQAAEVGVAVANAVPSLAEHADLVLDQADGEGIATLLAGPLLAGHQRLCPPRQWVQVGEFEDGQATCVPGSQTSVLISGDTGAGKSYLAGLLAERWIEAGYSVLVVDREGDHLGLATRPGVHLVDAAEHLPTPSDLLAIARPNRASIVLDLSGRSTDTKLDYVRRLPAAISAERALHGIPHWVVHDEAHEELWAADTQTAKLAVAEPGLCLVTWQPDSLPDEVRRSLAVMLTVTEAPGPPRPAPLRATAQFAGEQARPFRIGERLSTHVRHQHKYATTPLPHHRRFYFHDTDGGMPAVASLDEFRQHLRHCDLDTLDYHLTRGDFSRWVIGTLADHDLGADLAAIEHDLTMHRASELERARRRTIDSIERRYLTPPDR